MDYETVFTNAKASCLVCDSARSRMRRCLVAGLLPAPTSLALPQCGLQAGMEGVDPEHVKRVVYEASKVQAGVEQRPSPCSAGERPMLKEEAAVAVQRLAVPGSFSCPPPTPLPPHSTYVPPGIFAL